MAKRRRRPRHLRGPKIYGYTIPDGILTHAGDALKGGGLYTVAWRDANRKKRPRAKEGLRSSYYFAFTKNGTWHLDPVTLEREGMSPTHRMLQEIIREYGFVQCDVNGQNIWYQYANVELEKHSAPVYEIGKGARRTDVSGSVKDSNTLRLVGTEVATEIGVTSLVVAYERYFDLVKSGITTLEIVVNRDKDLEKSPTKLVNHLKRLLLNGELKGRWIVAPWRKNAKIVPLHDVTATLQDDISRETAASESAQRDLADLEAQMRTIPKPQSLSSIDRRKVDDLNKETKALFESAIAKNARDLDDVDFFTRILELVFPKARTARERTLREQLQYAMDEIRAEDSMKRAGFLTHIKKLESAIITKNDEIEAQRRELILKTNVAKMSHAEADRRRRAAEIARVKVEDLLQVGMTRLLLPSGTNLHNAVDFEHRRWCR